MPAVKKTSLAKPQPASKKSRTSKKSVRTDEHLRTVFSALEEGVVMRDKTGRVVMANPSAERLLGLSMAELASLDISQPPFPAVFADGSEFPREQHPVNVTLQTGKPQRNLVMGIRRDNESITWLSVNSQPVFGGRSRKPQAVVTSFEDITNKRSAEEFLAVMFRAVDASSSGIAITDALAGDYPVIYCNRAFEQITGYTSQELMGKNLRMLAGPLTEPEGITSIRDAMSACRDCRLSLTGYRKDGTPFNSEVSISPLFDNTGHVTHFINVSNDITATQQAAAENARLAAMIAASPDAISSSNIQGNVDIWNPGAERLYGYTAEEIRGVAVSKVVPEDQRENFSVMRQRVLAGESFIGHETERITKEGRRITVSLSLAPVRDHEGKVVGMTGIAQDVSEMREALAQLHASERKFRLALNAIPDAFVMYDTDLRLQFANSKAVAMYGSPLYSIVHRTDAEILPLETTQTYTPTLELARDSKSTQSVEGILAVRDRQYPIFATYVPMLDDSGQLSTVLGIITDLTNRKQMEERLAFMAQYDALTGLPNRYLLLDRLDAAIIRAQRNSTLLGVMFLDLDRFKEVNDTRGHAAGDILLQQVSERLAGALRATDTIARLGGDEFTVLVENTSSIDEITAIADKIRATFSNPFETEAGEIFTTTSIGITIYPFDGNERDALLKNADVAMYIAKQERNAWQLYHPEMNANTAARLGIEGQLRRALEREEFELYFQSQIELKTGAIIGVEALIRWNNRDLGSVAPGDFIPIAEETGLIVPIGEWILRAACAHCKEWERAGVSPLTVAVNIAAPQFRRSNLLRLVESALSECSLDPHWLALEITESSIMKHAEQTIKTLQDLRALGVQLAIDDFGTGYSSLSYLKRFPVDKIKVDQSFVQDINNDPNDAAIVSAILAMSKQLSLKTVAEGVETVGQLEFLASMQCDEYQGYHFSRALPASDIPKLLLEHQAENHRVLT
jgi:diguanylate cyclase (GGDEF)-like protein/PAS domain S-box-containing protein